MIKDIAFEMAVSSVRVGVGVTREVGMDLQELGARLVMVVTDPIVARLPPARTVIDSLEQNGIAYAVYDRVRVEPSDESFLDAIAFGRERPFDAIVFGCGRRYIPHLRFQTNCKTRPRTVS